jgi:nucleoside-diphosphate-sugar epimerase
MKTILTGTSGYVQQNLSNYLTCQNHQIHSFSLRNADWINNFDNNANAIIHLAGKAHDTKNTSNASEYFAVNTEIIKQVFLCFMRQINK